MVILNKALKQKSDNKIKNMSVSLACAAALALPVGSFAAEGDHQHHQHTQAAQAVSHVHHKHGAGQWMFEYRYMSMTMEDLLDGSDSVAATDVANMMGPYGYMMTPTEMTMDMHMLMVMYGVSDKTSVMVMFNSLDNSMDMLAMNGMTSTMETSGTGDTLVGVMYQGSEHVTAGLMVSIPTGSIDEEITMRNPMSGMVMERPAPSGMQLGSGTYDLIPSMTINKGGYGGMVEVTHRMDENDNEYTLGNKLKLSAWKKFKLGKAAKAGIRLDHTKTQKTQGLDPRITMVMSPTDDNDATGGTRTDLTLDVTGQFGPSTVGVAYTTPISQSLNGPQLELQSILTVNFQLMF